jgi:hypothetical protein
MNKLESKVLLMNELLESVRENYINRAPAADGSKKVEKMVKGDVYDVCPHSGNTPDADVPQS